MKYILCLLLLVGLLLTGCSDDKEAAQPTQSAPVISPTQAPTPVPDFSQTDFTGIWYVSGIITADGNSLSENEVSLLDAGFTLELLPEGVYFVYQSNGNVLGQGQYSVSENLLICSADGRETVYVIQDKDTLLSKAPDDTTTIMTRRIEETEIFDDIEFDNTETDVPDEDTPIDGE